MSRITPALPPRSRRTTGDRPAARPRRPAFTLVEMLVSLAVLTLVLSVVGVVFTITTKTASQAAAYSEVQNWAREFTTQIEEDLRYCDPSRSVLVLSGRTQAAARTKDELDARQYLRVLVGDPAAVPAGYDPTTDSTLNAQYSNPRADVMMFLTCRPTVSQAPPGNPDPNTVGDSASKGAKFSPIEVVYGHAALTEPVWKGSAYTFPDESSGALRHIAQTVDGYTIDPLKQSRIPACEWHLARRATILVSPATVVQSYAGGKFTLGDSYTGCGDEWTRITRCEADAVNKLPGDVAFLDVYGEFLEVFGPHNFTGDPNVPRYSPYTFGFPGQSYWGPWSGIVAAMLYYQGYNGSYNVATQHVATVLTQVPVELRSNLGVHLLPGCAWFQVEFLMPEDPRNSVEYSDDPTGARFTRSEMPRWMSIEPNQIYVFVPDTQENREMVAREVEETGPNAGEPKSRSRLATFAKLDPAGPNTAGNRIIRMWPYAIRVTVRVYDSRGRLDRPFVRSIVHRFD